MLNLMKMRLQMMSRLITIFSSVWTSETYSRSKCSRGVGTGGYSFPEAFNNSVDDIFHVVALCFKAAR